MKKHFTILMLLAALSGGASASPYVLPSAQPGALTPYDWQPVYAIEGLYSMGDSRHTPDTWGVRGSLNLYSNAINTVRNQFGLYAGFESGSQSEHGLKVDMRKIPLTLGYDLNLALTDHFMIYMGGKTGYAFGHLKASNPHFSSSQHPGGFTFSLGGGIKYQCSESIYLKAGYEFSRTYFRDCHFGSGSQRWTPSQHVISIGVGCLF